MQLSQSFQLVYLGNLVIPIKRLNDATSVRASVDPFHWELWHCARRPLAALKCSRRERNLQHRRTNERTARARPFPLVL